MTLDELEYLRGPGAALLDSLDLPGEDPLRRAERLRREVSADRARLLQEQAGLRERARAKFGEASSRMLFTRRLLEQATGPVVAQRKAARLRAAGVARLADLCCGSGGDAIESSRAGMAVELVDLDPVALELARHNLAVFGFAPAGLQVARLPELPASFAADAFHLDPDRRTAGRERGEDRWDHAGLSPDPAGIRELARAFRGGAVKLSPGTPPDLLELPGETEFLGVRDEVREQVLWIGDLSGGDRLRASEWRDGRWETTSASRADSEDAFGEEPPEEPGGWIYEPVKALVRSHLFAWHGRERGLSLLDGSIAWLTGGEVDPGLLLKAYRVLAHGPLRAGAEESLLREAGCSCGAVKKRGVAVVPEKALRALRGLPGEPATLVYTRFRGRKWVFVAEARGFQPDDDP